ncbi:MAG: chromatin associated protein KTI12 [Monoraphidium minutum]|nr:MAG: chromatin associated protein KTI12 [Monoraphidium minutum]
MPLVVLAGQPASGKSGAAARLRELLAPHGPVELIDEPSLHLTRNTSYASSAQEKVARATLKSALERVLTRHNTVILDSLNAIKGYRYEVWCVVRSVGTRYCVVHVDTPVDTCREWNGSRPEAERYSSEIFEDLVRRFETPDSRNRWDAPLFTLRPAGDPGQYTDVLAGVVAVATGGTAAPGVASNAGAGERLLTPNLATTNPGLLGTNVLHEIDHAAQAVVDAISAAQAQAGGGAAGLLDLGPGAGRLQLDRPVTLAELRRHKRSFLKLATKITFSRVATAAAAQRLFVEYLAQQAAAAAAI